MATYHPPPFPRRPKNSTLFSDLRYQSRLFHYRYKINTAQYVMSPGEKLAYNVIFWSFVVLFFSAVYYYLPSAVYLSIERLAYYCTGRRKIYLGGLSGGVGEVLMNSREAVVSLKEAGNVS